MYLMLSELVEAVGRDSGTVVRDTRTDVPNWKRGVKVEEEPNHTGMPETAEVGSFAMAAEDKG